MKLNGQAFLEFARFHRHALDTSDVDPSYPVIRSLLDAAAADRERRLWFLMVFLAFYHLGSALQAWKVQPDPGPLPEELLKLPAATERRGHRDPAQLRAHLRSLAALSNERTLSAALTEGLPAAPTAAWTEVGRRLRAIRGNGRWASYKGCELIQTVMGLNLRAPDMGHAFSTGPRQGLRLLYPELPTGNDRESVAAMDRASAAVLRLLADRGLPARMEQVETTLCDYHALASGRYYVGHDIDQMQTQLSAFPESAPPAFAARAKTLPNAYLGELGGWVGVDRNRSRVYLDRRLIVLRA